MEIVLTSFMRTLSVLKPYIYGALKSFQEVKLLKKIIMFENSRFDNEMELYESGGSGVDNEILSVTNSDNDQVTITFTKIDTNINIVISGVTMTLEAIKRNSTGRRVEGSLKNELPDIPAGTGLFMQISDDNKRLTVGMSSWLQKKAANLLNKDTNDRVYTIDNPAEVGTLINFIRNSIDNVKNLEFDSEEFETEYFFGKKKNKNEYDKPVSINDLKEGDIIVSTTRNIISTLIRSLSGSTVSHSILYIGNGEVIEAIGRGVTRRSLEEATRHSKHAYVLRYPELSSGQVLNIKDYAINNIGKKFDKWGLVKTGLWGIFKIGENKPGKRSELRFYCSELILNSYKNAGIELFESTQRRPGDIEELSGSKLDCVGHIEIEDNELESIYDIENYFEIYNSNSESGQEYFDIPFFGPSAEDIRNEIENLYLPLDKNKKKKIISSYISYLATLISSNFPSIPLSDINKARDQATLAGVYVSTSISKSDDYFKESLSSISTKKVLQEIKNLININAFSEELEYQYLNNNSMENEYYLETDEEFEDEYEAYVEDEYEDYDDDEYEDDEYEYENEFEDEEEYEHFEDNEPEERYAERLDELSNESFESEYELEIELDEELEAMQKAYFEAPFEEEYRRRKIRRRRPRGRNPRARRPGVRRSGVRRPRRRRKGKGLFGKIIKAGAGVLGKVASATPIGGIIKAGANLVTGDFKGMAKNLAKGALGAIPIPGAGVIGGAVLDAVAPDEGEGEVRRVKRSVARRVAKITREGFRELRENLPEDLEDREAVYEASKYAMRKAMAKNGVRPKRPMQRKHQPQVRRKEGDSSIKGDGRRIIRLMPGEQVLIIRPSK